MRDALQEQIDYYRARAGEYDEWFYRKGRYDRGSDLNRRWFAEAEFVAGALDSFAPSGDVLELACGTGIWTERLLRHARTVTAVDASPEVLALNRERVGSARVDHVQADLFAWDPPKRYDVAFFSFWLSHVPPNRFDPFWDLVRRALRPGGRFFLIDSLYDPGSTAIDQRLPERSATTQVRRLNDGSEFRIYKVFYEPLALQERLERLGWKAVASQSPTYFLFAHGGPVQRD